MQLLGRQRVDLVTILDQGQGQIKRDTSAFASTDTCEDRGDRRRGAADTGGAE